MRRLAVDGPIRCTRRRGALLRALALVALAAATMGGVSAPLGAQAPAAGDADTMVLRGEALSAAAAECGIGIAGHPVVWEEPTASAAEIPVGKLGEWVLGLLSSHVQGLVRRRLGLDQEYNRFLALSQQMRGIERQLHALDERFDRLAERAEAAAFRVKRREFSTKYINPVENGSQKLTAILCAEAAVLNARRLDRDPKQELLDLSLVVDDFRSLCEAFRFQDVPHDITSNLASDVSILEGYLAAVVRPRRYLTRLDSLELADFFYSYHLIQVQALRLRAECAVRFPPAGTPTGTDDDDLRLRESVSRMVYTNPTSDFHRATLEQLPQILPDPLPDNVMLDLETELLWWNGTHVGAHPHVNRRGLFSLRTIPADQWVEGRRFELASFAEIEKVAPLGAQMPLARGNGGRYPATLVGFLNEIGLERVAEKVAPSGSPLGFVWASDIGKPIRRCYADRLNTHRAPSRACTKWFDPHETLGHSAAAALANGPSLRVQPGNGVLYAPQGCPPEECRKGLDSSRWRNPNVVSLCADPTLRTPTNSCIPDMVLGMWTAPGIYRTPQLANDDFFGIDLTSLD